MGGQFQSGPSDFWQIDYGTLVGIFGLLIGLINLQENREQSAQSDELIEQIDVDAANDKQARLLLEELGRKFEEQNVMLKRILEVIERGNDSQ